MSGSVPKLEFAWLPGSIAVSLEAGSRGVVRSYLEEVAGQLPSFELDPLDDWADPTPGHGSAPGQVKIAVSAEGLAAGEHSTAVIARSAGVKSSALTIACAVTEVPWRETTSADWKDKVGAYFWKKDLDPETGDLRGWYVDGRCPRCDHDSVYGYVDTYIYKTLMASAKVDVSESASEPVVPTVRCRCPAPHPNIPTGEAGCGQAAPIRVRTSS